jgi:hypothetical protein
MNVSVTPAHWRSIYSQKSFFLIIYVSYIKFVMPDVFTIPETSRSDCVCGYLEAESCCWHPILNFPQPIRGVAKLGLQARVSVVLCRVEKLVIKTEWTVRDVTPLRTGL